MFSLDTEEDDSENLYMCEKNCEKDCNINIGYMYTHWLPYNKKQFLRLI